MLKRIAHTLIDIADFKRSRFRLTLPIEYSKEDISNPALWLEIAISKSAIKVGDIIEILREDFGFYATALVVLRDNVTGIKVEILSYKGFEENDKTEEVDSNSAIEIVWKGPTKKFCVVRKSDKREFKDKFANKEEARSYIVNNL